MAALAYLLAQCGKLRPRCCPPVAPQETKVCTFVLSISRARPTRNLQLFLIAGYFLTPKPIGLFANAITLPRQESDVNWSIHRCVRHQRHKIRHHNSMILDGWKHSHNPSVSLSPVITLAGQEWQIKPHNDSASLQGSRQCRVADSYESNHPTTQRPPTSRRLWAMRWHLRRNQSKLQQLQSLNGGKSLRVTVRYLGMERVEIVIVKGCLQTQLCIVHTRRELLEISSARNGRACTYQHLPGMKPSLIRNVFTVLLPFSPIYGAPAGQIRGSRYEGAVQSTASIPIA